MAIPVDANSWGGKPENLSGGEDGAIRNFGSARLSSCCGVAGLCAVAPIYLYTLRMISNSEIWAPPLPFRRRPPHLPSERLPVNYPGGHNTGWYPVSFNTLPILPCDFINCSRELQQRLTACLRVTIHFTESRQCLKSRSFGSEDTDRDFLRTL